MIQVVMSRGGTKGAPLSWLPLYELQRAFGATTHLPQDEITLAICGAIEPELRRREPERSVRHPERSVDSWELLQRGIWHLDRGTKEDNEAAIAIEKLILETRFTTPRKEELKDKLPRFSGDRVKRVLKILVDHGSIVSLKDGGLMHRDTIEEAMTIVKQVIEEQGQIEAAQFRDKVGTTRKYVIPLLEHLDDIKFTQRQGNARVLRPTK